MEVGVEPTLAPTLFEREETLLILKKSSLQSTNVTDEFVQIQVEKGKKKAFGKTQKLRNKLTIQFVTGKNGKSNGK